MSRLTLLLALALAVYPAAAARADTQADDQELATDGESWFVVPGKCHALAAVPLDSPTYWNARMSLAACVLDLPPVHITDADSIDGALRDLAVGAMPALVVYEDLVASAPQPVRFRAAYHVALVVGAIMTRARGGLPADAPPALREVLEDHLVETTTMVRTVVESLDEVAAREPATVADPVNRAIAKTVHAQVLTWR